MYHVLSLAKEFILGTPEDVADILEYAAQGNSSISYWFLKFQGDAVGVASVLRWYPENALTIRGLCLRSKKFFLTVTRRK